MNATGRERWFTRLAVLFAAWNLIGAAAALGAAVLWSKRISEAPVPAVTVVRALVPGVVAVLAVLAAAGPRRRRKQLWWLALALSLGESIVGAARHGVSPEDWIDLVILVFVALASVPLTRSLPPVPTDVPFLRRSGQ